MSGARVGALIVPVRLRRNAYLVLPVFEVLRAHSAVPVAVKEGVGVALNLIPVDGDIAVVCCDWELSGNTVRRRRQGSAVQCVLGAREP